MSHLTDLEQKKALCARLARAEGQLRGIQRLIQDDADCEKIAGQLAAARKALDKSFFFSRSVRCDMFWPFRWLAL